MRSCNQAALIAGLALIGLLALPFAYAQRGQGAGQRARNYNPADETTVKGTVAEVKTVTGRHGWNGTHLTLKVKNNATNVQENVEKGKVVGEKTLKEGSTFEVHLGPAAFLKDKGFSFAKGDQIEVTGAATILGSSKVLIAREVKKGSETLVLRDTQGIPKWSGGWRR
jgi:hypothetical protein